MLGEATATNLDPQGESPISRQAAGDLESQVRSTTSADPMFLRRQYSNSALKSSSRRFVSVAKPMDATLSETSEKETHMVRPILRSERNFDTNRSRESTEVRPTDHPAGVGPIKPSLWSSCCSSFSNVKPGSKAYQAYLTYLTLGVIYGDIGTSPLYTMSAVFPHQPTDTDSIIGGVSLMIWTLIIVSYLKYIIFILLADDYGEGGTFAMFALLSRGLRQKIKSDKVYNNVNYFLSVIAICSVACILSDGVLTPAISVMGAINGLSVVSPNVTNGIVAGVSIAIIFLFFLPQRYGTSKISVVFSPIIVLWYIFLLGIGIHNITLWPTIFRALNPYEAILFLGGTQDGFGGWAAMGSAFLTVTGSEAMYADLGHFNRLAIRLSSTFIVMPCLIFAYLGQGAGLAVNPSAYSNVMFLTLPNGLLYPMLILGTLASIVASQAMVSATFSIVAQAMRLQFFPRLTVKHTDRLEYGQVYVPEVNYLLMVLVIIIVRSCVFI